MKTKNNILKKLNNERGSLLIISYFMIIILLGIGTVFVLFSTNESRIAERQRLTTTAFHIAEAGIERALYDLRQDFILDTTPSWADGDINSHTAGPNFASFYTMPYSDTTFNGGSYSVQLQNTNTDDVWLQSTGTLSGVGHSVLVYVKMINVSPWNNAIFGGSGASGSMINGNVDIRGSVHILGDGLAAGDFAIDLGGTSELVGNNYNGLDPTLEAKVPALPTTVFNGEVVETLSAELRVKEGLVGLSGSSTVGDANVAGNSEKETVDAAYVTDGYGGNLGAANVHSDNGTSNGYDLGEVVSFPNLTTEAYSGYPSYQDYLAAHSLVLTTELNNITPNSSFAYSNGDGSIAMDGNGNLTISGVVYIDGDNDLNMSKVGSDKTINYVGNGSILVEGNAQIDVNLVTSGNNSFPNNILGIMTPNNIGFNEASIDVMGLFYAEGTVQIQKQTDIMGTVITNYFDMGTNVPSIYQVPETLNNLPAGLIGQETVTWYLLVAWIKT